MQTFLPYSDFAASAASLDDRRLGKQRVEALQILRALHFPGYGWSSHPAVLMWQGFEAALVAYGLAMTAAWTARGHDDRTGAQIAEFALPGPVRTQPALEAAGALPPWLGDVALHRSHRSALLRKDPATYRSRFDDEPDDLDYVWPPPPGPPRELGPACAWLLRPAPAVPEWREEALVAVEVPAVTGRSTKHHREVQRFLTDIATGDQIVVPDGDEVRVGAVIGPASSAAEGTVLVREVRWGSSVPRAALVHPWQLQNPARVAVLRAEPALGCPA